MATSTLLLSLLLLQQDPAGAPAAKLDQVELTGGEVLEGRIVVELGNYIEIELEPGSTVGFRKTDVAAVRRGAGRAVAAAPPEGLRPRDEWFRLQDGAGRPVGWLHATITRAGDGTTRLHEEWEFSQDRRHFQVTMLETTDGSQRPATCYFRERVSEEVIGRSPTEPTARSSRIVAERIITARIEGELLQVERLTPEGRTESQLRWPAGALFPLLARAQQRDAVAAATLPVYDPAIEELASRTFAAERQRTVAIDGIVVPVREHLEQSPNGDNAVWLDAGAQVLRREIAGPALVAVPCAADEARAAVRAGNPGDSAFVADPTARIGLWRPNPAWEVLPGPSGITLHCAPHGSTITLSILDHLDPGTPLSVAADAVERWFRLLRPDSRRDRRDYTKVRDRDAIVLTASRGHGAREERATIHVIPWQQAYAVLVCTAPAASWDELQRDFAQVVQQIELEPGAVAPIAKETPAVMAQVDAGAPPPVPVPAAPVRPRVRVPKDEPPATGR